MYFSTLQAQHEEVLRQAAYAEKRLREIDNELGLRENMLMVTYAIHEETGILAPGM